MSPFASQTVVRHVGRGVGATLLAALAVWLLSYPGTLSGTVAIAFFIGAVVLLRGCPMCWFIGLIETISIALRKEQSP